MIISHYIDFQQFVRFCVLLIMIIGLPLRLSHGSQKTSQNQGSLPSPRTALIKSAIIPGWGQFYNKDYLKSIGFFGTEVYIAHQFYLHNKELRNINNETSENRVKYERNTWVWRYLLVYLLSLADAYVDAHLAGFPEEEQNVSFAVEPGMNMGIRLNLNLRF